MDTFRSFANGLLFKVRRTMTVTAFVAAGVAAFAAPTEGAAVTRGAHSDQKAASGTVAVTDRQVLLSYRDGQDLIQERLVHRRLTGTFAGTEVAVAHYVIHPDGSATVTAVSSCSCSVERRTGTVTFLDEGTVTVDGVISASREIVDSAGGLAGLRAVLKIAGNVKEPAQTYSGHYEFGDED